jgi:hypothetical protein
MADMRGMRRWGTAMRGCEAVGPMEWRRGAAEGAPGHRPSGVQTGPQAQDVLLLEKVEARELLEEVVRLLGLLDP